jgi:ADP-dependent NAD(P)H-hydrate dehydratase
MSREPIMLDSAWIAAHPAPVHGDGTTKNSRGRVLVIGGSCMVPGAIRLTGEAALRAGAGKLQMATVAAAAISLGVIVPEAGVIALWAGDGGEIAPDAAAALSASCGSADVIVLGPGMGDPDAAGGLLDVIVGDAGDETLLLLDAAAITAMSSRDAILAPFRGRIVITPHHGEMASLTGKSPEAIADDAEGVARDVAERFGAVVVLKASSTVIAAPGEEPLLYGGGGIGMATAGSGDVLAGAVAGIASRGAEPVVAAGWGVWLHGQGGRRAATLRGPIGFLARELPEEFPQLLPQ